MAAIQSSPMTFWARVKDHKIIQWGLAYLGAALAFAHAQALVANAFHWPDAVVQIFILALIVGFPIALTLAWYHGHRGLQRVSAGELMIISLLLVIGAAFFTVALRPNEHAGDGAALVTPQAEAATAPETASIEAPSRRAEAPVAAESGLEPVTPAAESRLRNSVAVLPCDNLSPNAQDEYFAAGFHDQVLNHLAKLNDVTVIARTSVLPYAGANKRIQEIGRELNVESVMECSVRYADGQVRITTQLIDAFTEAHLWSETYTRPFENIFAIETDIATQVAAALEAELAPEERRTLNKQPTASAEAYAFYLRAINAVRYEAGGLGVSEEDVAEFRRYIDRALELDPDFALALAAKARDYAYAIARPIERSAGLGPEDVATLAVASAERALALDPETGLAYAALSIVHRFNWREREARLALEKALALSPNDYQVLFDAVLLNMYTGRHEAALEFAERVARINPVEGFLPLALAHLFKGDIDEAATLLAGSERYLYMRAQAEVLRGRREEALRHVNRLAEQSRLTPPSSFSGVAYLYRAIGAEAEALRNVARFEDYAEDYVVGPGERALAALSAGKQPEALEWLRRAAARRAPGPDWLSLHTIAANRFSDPVLEQPEFVEVRGRLGWR